MNRKLVIYSLVYSLLVISSICISFYGYESVTITYCSATAEKVVNKFLYKNEHSLHKLITLVLYNNEKITSTYGVPKLISINYR